MIVIKLQGGLGNQLFQWAYSVALSEKFNARVLLDTHLFGHPIQQNAQEHIKHYLLDKIVSSKIDTINFPLESESFKNHIINIFDHHKYKPLDYNRNNIYYMDGYWQSEKYIIEYKNKIISKLNLNVTSDFDFKNSCSIHVRRGDYLYSNGFHPVQDLNYFKKALDIIAPTGKIFIFSNDINWCKNNFNFKNLIFIEQKGHWIDSAIKELKLMSMCENNIISNSSFSWWGAWLNKNSEKKVVCPIKWFGSIPDCDIKPENWIKI